MREIKFRAWDMVKHQMLDAGDFRLLWETNNTVSGMAGVGTRTASVARLMQYTGLKDKNGKEIYEGDIVVADWHWTQPHAIELPSDYYDFSEYAMEDNVTIIGNIYENPELVSK